MKDSASFVPPQSNPPPYSGVPGQNFSPTTAQPQMSGVTVVTHPPIIVQGPSMVPAVMGNPLGSNPCQAYCRSCHVHAITRIKRTPSLRTHLVALFLCAIGFWPCVCIPYCMNSCNNSDHYCSNCNAYIGSYNS